MGRKAAAPWPQQLGVLDTHKSNKQQKTRNMKIAIFLFVSIYSITLASDAEDFNPLDHVHDRSINEHIRGIEVQVDEGEPKVHLDERCRCVCPAFDVPNVARMSGQVYTGQVDNAQDCSCANIVLPSIPDLQKANYGLVESQACPLCQCSYQRRNLTIIYLCVVFILVIISGFALYLLLSQVIWPKIGVSFSYKQQHDDEHLAMEEVNEDSSGQVKSSDFDSYSATASSSRFSWVNSLSRQQQKWRQDLHRQQKNIYQDHAMLN